MGWKDPKDKPKQIEYMNRIIRAIRPPIEKRQLIFSAMHFVNHWVLLVINLVEKSYEVYDSLKQHPKVDLQDYVSESYVSVQSIISASVSVLFHCADPCNVGLPPQGRTVRSAGIRHKEVAADHGNQVPPTRSGG